MAALDATADARDADILEMLRRLGSSRLAPLVAEVDRTQKFSRELWEELTSVGLTGLPFDLRIGGAGGSFALFMRTMEELAFFGAVCTVYCGTTIQVARSVLKYGDAEQVENWVTPLVVGQKMGAWAFTEPQTGSDPRQIETHAVRRGSDWVLNGSKMFISFAAEADVAMVFAKTSADRLGAFLVETSNPGWQPGPSMKFLALGGMGTAAVTLDDVRVPAAALVGAEDGGFGIMVGTEAEGKVRAAAACTGVARRALEESARYATQREHRSEPIGTKFPTIRSQIGEMSANVEAGRALVGLAAVAIDDEEPVSRLAASARIVCARVAREVTSDAMQVCGAYGLTHEMPLERLYREGKFYEVGQGVIELQRQIVGKERLREIALSDRLG